MSTPIQYYTSTGINTYENPVSKDGVLIHAVNVISFPYGAKAKRTGYSAFLGTPDTNTVKDLWSFYFPNTDTFYLYRKSGSLVYYSAQGTGAWTVAANGTVNATAHVGNATLGTAMIIGDGTTATRHTVDGTTFVDTTLAPYSNFFAEYQNRIYASGTANNLFYSSANDGTNWSTSGTSDSSSLAILGAGINGHIFKCGDRLVIPKTSGMMFKWDGYSLVDMCTKYGPVSQYSIGEIEDYRFFINRFGLYGFDGSKPKLISNAIQNQFYNSADTGIAGTAFSSIPSSCHIYDYMASVGTVTDDFTGRTMNNCIIKYDYLKNEYLNWDLAHKPTSWLSYKDNSGNQKLIFGTDSGQVYQFDNTTSDAGTSINSELIFVYTWQQPEYEKKWNWYRAFFNPGCQAKVQIACSNTYNYASLKWIDLGDTTSGEVEYRFPGGTRSRFLFVRIYESSTTARWKYLGCSIDAQVQVQL